MALSKIQGAQIETPVDISAVNLTGVSTVVDLNATRINVTGVSTFSDNIIVGITTFVVDNDRGMVAIGTAIPGSSLHIKGNAGTIHKPRITLEETGSLKGVFFVESTRSGSANRLDIGEGTDTFLCLISDHITGTTADRG